MGISNTNQLNRKQLLPPKLVTPSTESSLLNPLKSVGLECDNSALGLHCKLINKPYSSSSFYSRCSCPADPQINAIGCGF